MKLHSSISIAAISALLVLALMVRAAESAPPKRIVALGDSITDGHTYPMLIIQALREAGRPVPVIINAGAGGDTAEKMLNRLDDDVLQYNPDLVILNIGRNDCGRVPPELFRERVAKILDRFRDAKIPVVMSTITAAAPRLAETDKKRLGPLNDVLRQLAKERSLPIVQVYDRMFEKNDSNTLQEPDGIHLQFAGYRLFTRAMLDALGYPEVAVPERLKITPLPGIVETWHFKQSPDGKPLTNEAVAKLAVDRSWTEYKLPETQPVEDWWPDSMRRWGVADEHRQDDQRQRQGCCLLGPRHDSQRLGSADLGQSFWCSGSIGVAKRRKTPGATGNALPRLASGSRSDQDHAAQGG